MSKRIKKDNEDVLLNIIDKQERYAKNEFSAIDEILSDDEEDGDQIGSIIWKINCS